MFAWSLVISLSQLMKISQWQDSRYVSVTEACWRLFGYSLHHQSPTVYRLKVHLPEQQTIVFRDNDNLNDVLERRRNTMLTDWLALNQRDPEVNQYLYTEIPTYYWFQRGTWRRRERGSQGTIGRLYFVQPRETERFALRLLLQHVRGATGFRHLRTVNGIEYPTFQAAARAHGLLQNDIEWAECLQEASVFEVSARELRRLFAFILALCQPSSPLDLE